MDYTFYFHTQIQKFCAELTIYQNVYTNEWSTSWSANINLQVFVLVLLHINITYQSKYISLSHNLCHCMETTLYRVYIHNSVTNAIHMHHCYTKNTTNFTRLLCHCEYYLNVEKTVCFPISVVSLTLPFLLHTVFHYYYSNQ